MKLIVEIPKPANVLDFVVFDPVEAGESWTDCYPGHRRSKAVEIYIDGKKLLDRIREIEEPFAASEGMPDLAGDYGHLPPEWLYHDLKNAVRENGAPDRHGVELYCCAGCGDPGCWSVCVNVKEDDRFVYWYDFFHNHRKWIYLLFYRFEKTAYEQALQKLIVADAQ